MYPPILLPCSNAAPSRAGLVTRRLDLLRRRAGVRQAPGRGNTRRPMAPPDRPPRSSSGNISSSQVPTSRIRPAVHKCPNGPQLGRGRDASIDWAPRACPSGHLRNRRHVLSSSRPAPNATTKSVEILRIWPGSTNYGAVSTSLGGGCNTKFESVFNQLGGGATKFGAPMGVER